MENYWNADDPWGESIFNFSQEIDSFAKNLAACQKDIPPEFYLSDEDLMKCV